MPQKGNALLIVLLLVLIVGASGYFLYTKGYFDQFMPQPQVSQNTDVFNYGVTQPSQTSPSSQPSAVTTSQEVGNVASSNIKLTIAYPANGATLNSTDLTVMGKTSADADVFINDQTTKADANGNFSLKITLDEGQNGLVVTANDANGNIAEQDLSVNVQSF